MKRISNLKKDLNFERVLPYALVFVLSFLGTNVNTIHNAMGQVSTEEPYISLNVKNKPLGDVLKKISEDTGYKFELNDQWSGYPVYASYENVPLHQVLKRILGRLNHTIIYESDKRVNIVIYAEADSSQIQQNQQEPAPSPELPPEKVDDLERANESSKETGASEGTEEISTEKKESAENAEKDSTEKTSAVESKESDKDSSSQSENSNEQNEQKKVDEDASPDSPQKEN
ncbi:hypothetical protein ACFL0M_14725 [Thermodesulfobacteriota bacterium]